MGLKSVVEMNRIILCMIFLSDRLGMQEVCLWIILR